MVMRPEPLFDAVEAAQPPRPLLLLVGERSALRPGAWRASSRPATGFSLLCGRYEGVDQRVADHLCDGEVSVGDVVLAGGEAGALVIIEAVTPAASRASWATTRRRWRSPSPTGCSSTRSTPGPAEFRGWAVPEVLRSGDHARIARVAPGARPGARTAERRPDLLAGRARSRPPSGPGADEF